MRHCCIGMGKVVCLSAGLTVLYSTSGLPIADALSFDYVVGVLNMARGVAAPMYNKPLAAGTRLNLGPISDWFLPHGLPQTWPSWALVAGVSWVGMCLLLSLMYACCALVKFVWRAPTRTADRQQPKN